MRNTILQAQLRELKFAESGDEMTFSGYGSVFGVRDYYGDVIAKGAFKTTLKEAKASGRYPAMLCQHGSFLGGEDNNPIGIWTDLVEDDIGLKVDGKLAPTARGQEAWALLKMQPRPAIDGLSIGFIAKEWSVGTKPDEPRRTLKEVELWEVSLVTFPANPDSRVQVKAADRFKTVRDLEAFLRDEGGFSHAAAKAIASRGFREADARDEPVSLDGLTASLKRMGDVLTPSNRS